MCVQYVSTILIHYSLQMISPFTVAVNSEALWQCTPLQHSRPLQLINGVELSAVVYSFLEPPNGLIDRI